MIFLADFHDWVLATLYSYSPYGSSFLTVFFIVSLIVTYELSSILTKKKVKEEFILYRNDLDDLKIIRNEIQLRQQELTKQEHYIYNLKNEYQDYEEKIKNLKNQHQSLTTKTKIESPEKNTDYQEQKLADQEKKAPSASGATDNKKPRFNINSVFKNAKLLDD